MTNTGGDRWFIWHNRIEGLTLFDCNGLCTGGDAIVLQIPSASMAAPGGNAAPINRPEQNVVIGNRISGTVPDGFDDFGMVGILIFAADRTLVSHNVISIPDNPLADAQAHGVVVTNICCGDFTSDPTGGPQHRYSLQRCESERGRILGGGRRRTEYARPRAAP